MNLYDWPGKFREVYAIGSARWLQGHKTASSMFPAAEAAFLATIGCTTQELFDFIDDFHRYGEPDYETTLLVTAVRQDYFHRVMGGKASGKVADMSKLPAKSAEVDGIPWLPRLIEKAKIKLRGEMPPELMYGCGGDRPFLQEAGIGLAEFLRVVWESNGNDRLAVDYYKRRRASR